MKIKRIWTPIGHVSLAPHWIRQWFKTIDSLGSNRDIDMSVKFSQRLGSLSTISHMNNFSSTIEVLNYKNLIFNNLPNNLLVATHRSTFSDFQLLTAKCIASFVDMQFTMQFNSQQTIVQCDDRLTRTHSEYIVSILTMFYRKVKGIKVIASCNFTCQFEQTSLL